jgi:DNA-binding CsgD family transcriptional regulator
VVLDVLIMLGHVSEPLPAADPWVSVQETRAGECTFGDALEGNQVLFAAALRIMLAALPDDPVDVAAALNRRLSAEVAVVADLLSRTNVLEVATKEVVDEGRAREILTAQQVRVFSLMLQRQTTNQIAATLGISPKTVKNHITSIGDRFGGTGRDELVRLARAVQVLITVPVVVFGAAITDAVDTLSSML